MKNIAIELKCEFMGPDKIMPVKLGNAMHAHLFEVSEHGNIDWGSIVFNAKRGQVFRVGFYDGENGYPENLVLDVGKINFTSTTMQLHGDFTELKNAKWVAYVLISQA